VKRVVLFSTIAAYGPSDGRVLNEMSPTHPDTFYAQTKCAAEQIVLNARGADGQPLGTVLRLGAVHGSRIKGNYERLVCSLAGNLGTRSRILANSGHVPIIPPITKAIIDKYTEDIAVDGSLIKRELGFVPEYDLKTGWEETIREMQGKTKC
jgi:nucleoside-diphosphate-sugar epimerase